MAEHLPVDHEKPALDFAKTGPLNFGLYGKNIDARCDLAGYETVSQLPDRLAGIWIVVLNHTHPIPPISKRSKWCIFWARLQTAAFWYFDNSVATPPD